MHIGIDLGTTNSVIAAYDGSEVRVIPNALGEVLTPSVVRLDPKGMAVTGRRAFRYLETDPANTRGEFKRLMGSGERLAFPASSKSLLPEELSAAILSTLLADARTALGYTPRGAVISTPALFEIPQNHATTEAGRLAGLEEVVLIQEPVASAIAAGWAADSEGLWLVYDLGGGTLDVSLLETRGGWLRVVDHGGDNFLGGKDFDQTIVDWAVARLRAERPLSALSAQNPAARRALGKLKAACEQAKIDLSRANEATIGVSELCADDDGNPVDADLVITRAEFESLVLPLIQRSIAVCTDVLGRQRVQTDAIERVVFVGGPTLMPLLRERVGEALGGRVAEGVDPMTTVARGAALFAATSALEAQPKVTEPPSSGLAVRVEHPAVTADPTPWVVGRFAPRPGEALPVHVRVQREGGGFTTPDAPVSAEGGFFVQVELERHRQNRFRLVASDARAQPVALRSPSFAIVHGVSVADPPLSRTVGVALSDDTVHPYFEKGTPLPARRTFPHLTVQAVHPGAAEDALRVPIVQGDFHRAHRNRLIGTLLIRGVRLERTLPAAARVEVTLELDRSGQLRARADVAELGMSFEDVAHVLVPSASPDVLERELASAEARCADVRRRAFVTGAPEVVVNLGRASGLLTEAGQGMAAARGGDADSAQRVHRLLLEMNGLLDETEQQLEWPELEREAQESIQIDLSWVAVFGTPAEQRLFEEAMEGARQARTHRQSAELDRQLRVMRTLRIAAHARDPEFHERELDWCVAHLSEATDLRRAQELVEEGRAALARKDTRAVTTAIQKLRPLFPGTAKERKLSFDSGLR